MFSVHETNGTSGLSTCIVHILNTFLLMAAFSKLMRPGVGWTRTGLLHHGVAEIISFPLLAAAQRCDNFTRPCRWSPAPQQPGPRVTSLDLTLTDGALARNTHPDTIE